MKNMDLIFKMWNFGVFWICTVNSAILIFGIFLIYFWYIDEFLLLNLLSWKKWVSFWFIIGFLCIMGWKLFNGVVCDVYVNIRNMVGWVWGCNVTCE